MRRFPVAIKQITLSKFVSVEDVNSKGRGNNEYQNILASVNVNDYTVYNMFYKIIKIIENPSYSFLSINYNKWD